MTTARDPSVDHLIELLAPLGTATAKRMFGGWGIYLGGRMVGLVTGETAYLKTDPDTRAAFAAEGSVPFAYRGGGRMVETSYWSVPAAAMDSTDAMRPWAQRALDAALRKAQAKPVRKRKPKKTAPAALN